MSYLRVLADAIQSEMPASLVPESSAELFLLYAVLLKTKREAVTAADVHDAWTAWMEMRGMKHESMVPFEELPSSVRSEDVPFVQAIRQVAARLDH